MLTDKNLKKWKYQGIKYFTLVTCYLACCVSGISDMCQRYIFAILPLPHPPKILAPSTLYVPLQNCAAPKKLLLPASKSFLLLLQIFAIHKFLPPCSPLWPLYTLKFSEFSEFGTQYDFVWIVTHLVYNYLLQSGVVKICKLLSTKTDLKQSVNPTSHQLLSNY